MVVGTQSSAVVCDGRVLCRGVSPTPFGKIAWCETGLLCLRRVCVVVGSLLGAGLAESAHLQLLGAERVSLVVVGLNHQTSSVELRETLGFREEDIHRASLELRKECPDAGLVILSTCNRVELYLHDTQIQAKKKALRKAQHTKQKEEAKRDRLSELARKKTLARETKHNAKLEAAKHRAELEEKKSAPRPKQLNARRSGNASGLR